MTIGEIVGNTEFLFILTTLIIMTLVLLSYKLGKIYVISLTAVCLVLSNLVGPKIVSVFGFAITAGTPIFAALPLATDLLTEKYGKKQATQAVFAAFLAMFMLILISRPLASMTSLDFALESGGAVDFLLETSLRLLIASPFAYLVWQFVDIGVYFAIKKKTGEKLLWLRNNLSTWIAQAGSTLTFFALAFAGTETPWLEIAFVSIIFYWIIALLDTIFVYGAKRVEPLDCKKN